MEEVTYSMGAERSGQGMAQRREQTDSFLERHLAYAKPRGDRDHGTSPDDWSQELKLDSEESHRAA